MNKNTVGATGITPVEMEVLKSKKQESCGFSQEVHDKCTIRLRAIKDQSEFCKQLQSRLSERIQDITRIPWEGSGVPCHTQIQSDIIRLRRELLELSKMVGIQY